MATKYTSDNIETLKYPENLRKNASMYIGSVDDDGRWLVARELLDNGLDEFLAGRNNQVILKEEKDGSYFVYDAGSGIPQGEKKTTVLLNGKTVETTIPTMQAVFSEMHTSGKYRSEAYAVSVGSHGCGSKGTNATSDYFKVATCFENQWYGIGFEKGILKQPVKQIKVPSFLGKKLSKGTLIHFKHDVEIFSKLFFKLDKAHSWAEITSYLNPGFKVSIIDKNDQVTEYYSKLGPKELVNKQLDQLKAQAEPSFFEFKNELADVVVSFSNAESNNVRGYTNGLYNSDGGKHVDSVSNALYLACKPYAKSKQTVSAYDFKEGLVGIVNMHLHKAEFSSQDKLKLTDSRAGQEFQDTIFKAAEKFFAGNKSLAARLCEKASKLSELRNQFKASKKMITALNTAKKKGMPSKYAPFDSRSKLEDRELLIVEGESAGGNLREVRMPYQGLYPMKGKICNVCRQPAKILESDEVINILSAIGYDPKAEDPISKITVNKIVCLCDADDDGFHINTLLLTLFYTVLPELFDKGMVYVADMPTFYATYKDQLFTGSTLSEVKQKLATSKAPKTVQPHRIKGWGEIDSSLMKILSVDKATRKLIRIKALSDHDKVTFIRIMNEDVDYRRKMLGLSDNV